MKGRMKGRGEMRVGKMHWEEILENRRRPNRRRSGRNASIETFLPPFLLLSPSPTWHILSGSLPPFATGVTEREETGPLSIENNFVQLE